MTGGGEDLGPACAIPASCGPVADVTAIACRPAASQRDNSAHGAVLFDPEAAGAHLSLRNRPAAPSFTKSRRPAQLSRISTAQRFPWASGGRIVRRVVRSRSSRQPAAQTYSRGRLRHSAKLRCRPIGAYLTVRCPRVMGTRYISPALPNLNSSTPCEEGLR